MLALSAVALGVPREPEKRPALTLEHIKLAKAKLQAANVFIVPPVTVDYVPAQEYMTATELKRNTEAFWKRQGETAFQVKYRKEFVDQYRQRISEMENWIPKSEAQKAADDSVVYGTGVLRIEA